MRERDRALRSLALQPGGREVDLHRNQDPAPPVCPSSFSSVDLHPSLRPSVCQLQLSDVLWVASTRRRLVCPCACQALRRQSRGHARMPLTRQPICVHHERPDPAVARRSNRGVPLTCSCPSAGAAAAAGARPGAAMGPIPGAPGPDTPAGTTRSVNSCFAIPQDAAGSSSRDTACTRAAQKDLQQHSF